MRNPDYLKHLLFLIVLFSLSSLINAQSGMVLVEGGSYKMGRDSAKDKATVLKDSY